MKNLQELEELLKSYSIDGGDDWSYWIAAKDIVNCSSGKEATEAISEKLYRAVSENSDIIYHAVAMDFLKEHDPSLRNSLEIAGEMGYGTKDLNSELLASLLNYSLMMEALYDDLGKFASDFDDLEEEEEEEPDEE